MISYNNYAIYIILLCIIISCSIIFISCGDLEPIYIDHTKVETELLNRYSDLTNTSSKPDFYTSGILMHGVSLGEDGQTEIWTHRNKDRNTSVAFSWLRKDNQFKTSAYYNAGFIFYPYAKIPKGLDTLKPIAAFPFDAGTDVRKCNNLGAGPYCKCDNDLAASELAFIKNSGYVTPETSIFNFSSLGITSPELWFQYINSVKGFDKVPKKGKYLHPAMLFVFQPPIMLIKDDEESIKRNFALMGPIREYVKNLIANNTTAYKHLNPFINGEFSNNEILIESWDEDRAANMPIEYFYFTINNPKINSVKSLAQARYYKQSFFEKTGRNVPIIAIQFPTEGQEPLFIRFD